MASVRSYSFVTVDVFTKERFSGNPLAVFTDAAGLSDEEMQSLATEFNLSETTFVLPPDDPAHTARVRIFTKTSELAFAGHPNVGTGYVLAQMGRDDNGVLLLEELAGLVAVRVARDGSGEIADVTIDAPRPLALGQQVAADLIAECAGLTAEDVVTTHHAPIEASMGNPFVVAEVALTTLERAAPDTAAFRRLIAGVPDFRTRLSLYLYSRVEVGRDGGEIRARMFAPLAGITEDPATGSAAAPLAGLLLSLGVESSASFRIHQGTEMGRPSLLLASAWHGTDGIMAKVGGSCVPVLRGEVVL